MACGSYTVEVGAGTYDVNPLSGGIPRDLVVALPDTQLNDRLFLISHVLSSGGAGAVAFSAPDLTFEESFVEESVGNTYVLARASRLCDGTEGASTTLRISRSSGTIRDMIGFAVRVRCGAGCGTDLEFRSGTRADNLFSPGTFQASMSRGGNQGLTTPCLGDCRLTFYVASLAKDPEEPTFTHPFQQNGALHFSPGFSGREYWLKVMTDHQVYGDGTTENPPEALITFSWGTQSLNGGMTTWDNYQEWPGEPCDRLGEVPELHPRGPLAIRALPFELREDMLQTEPRSMGRRLR
jgi:hypothetical protein